jgi:hypothetical protein
VFVRAQIVNPELSNASAASHSTVCLHQGYPKVLPSSWTRFRAGILGCWFAVEKEDNPF